MTKPTPLEAFLKHHKSSCAIHIYSGDRHCSCGRDAAIVELVKLLDARNEAEKIFRNFALYTDKGAIQADEWMKKYANPR